MRAVTHVLTQQQSMRPAAADQLDDHRSRLRLERGDAWQPIADLVELHVRALLEDRQVVLDK